MTDLLTGYKKRLTRFLIDNFFSYDQERLASALRRIGIISGDKIMVHSSWLPNNGFRGRPVDMINTLKDSVGSDGLILMPSLTYQNESTRDFLLRGKPMDVRRSASKMGLLTEVFRRNREVMRSLSPTHPILAWGKGAEEILAGHERQPAPFGTDTPFSRLLDAGGKILAIDASFSTVTFTHFLEDRIASHLPCPLYEEEPVPGTYVDYDGESHTVPVKVLSDEANSLRREEILVAQLEKEGIIHRRKVGNTGLMRIDCKEMTACVDRMAAQGQVFFAAPAGSAAHA